MSTTDKCIATLKTGERCNAAVLARDLCAVHYKHVQMKARKEAVIKMIKELDNLKKWKPELASAIDDLTKDTRELYREFKTTKKSKS